MTRLPSPTALVTTAVAAVVALLLATPAAAPAAPTVPTQLNAPDMLLLTGVRQAGLWEIPAGQLAADRGLSPKVREIGAMIAAQHVKLDQLTVDAANELGATVPSTATPEQQGWVKEMTGSYGRRFDTTFVARLRAAHGKIFPVIGAVRASTRNKVIRELADQATVFVMNHMKMLESTGLVQYQTLPPAALPPGQDTTQLAIARANAGMTAPVDPLLLWGLLIGALALAAVTGLRAYRRAAAPPTGPVVDRPRRTVQEYT